MLTSINPLGQRGRLSTWWGTVLPYLGFSLLGGATTGLLLGAIGWGAAHLATPSTTGTRTVVAGALLIAAVADVASLSAGTAWRLPGGSRQVNQGWLTRYRGWVYGAGFGFQLGTGVVTVVTSAATYALLVLLVLTGSPAWSAAIGGVFGLVRALPILATRRVHTAGQLRRLAAGLAGWGRPVALGAAGTMALAGLTVGMTA